MKKITLKCYSYRAPERLLMQAANMIAEKTKTRTLSIRASTKSATINVAEPLLALAAADEIRRKTGVVVIVANLPTNVVHFVKFLKERGLLEEWCVSSNKRSCDLTSWCLKRPCSWWIDGAFRWPSNDTVWRQANNEWQTYILENNL